MFSQIYKYINQNTVLFIGLYFVFHQTFSWEWYFLSRIVAEDGIQVFSFDFNIDKGGAYCLHLPKYDHNKHLKRSKASM